MKRAQTTLENTFLIIIIIGALLAVSFYFKRAVQSRWKSALDDMGEQYDPQTQQTDLTYSIDATTNTHMNVYKDATGFWTKRWDWSNSVEEKTGYTKVMGGP